MKRTRTPCRPVSRPSVFFFHFAAQAKPRPTAFWSPVSGKNKIHATLAALCKQPEVSQAGKHFGQLVGVTLQLWHFILILKTSRTKQKIIFRVCLFSSSPLHFCFYGWSVSSRTHVSSSVSSVGCSDPNPPPPRITHSYVKRF